MHFYAILTKMRLPDVLDILLLTVMAYYLYSWFRQTKALKALVGLLGLGVVYTISQSWGLFLTTWVFQVLWQVLVILLIILFQSEIRQVLERVNPLRALGLRKASRPEEWIPGLAEAVFRFSRRKIGALIILERGDLVEEHITEGQSLDAEPSPQLLHSIFQKDSPLHDGAVLIRQGRISRVACYLPLSGSEDLPKEWGTRHRAALGLTERCDAWVVVVSEERGHVSISRQKEMVRVDDAQAFSRLIMEAITPMSHPEKRWWQKTRFALQNRWQAKLASLGLVSVLWLLLAGQQNFEVNLSIPIEITNLPVENEIITPVNPEVAVRVRGLRKDAATLSRRDILVELDLSSARGTVQYFRITRDNIRLDNERLSVVSIEPSQVRFEFRPKP